MSIHNAKSNNQSLQDDFKEIILAFTHKLSLSSCPSQQQVDQVGFLEGPVLVFNVGLTCP